MECLAHFLRKEKVVSNVKELRRKKQQHNQGLEHLILVLIDLIIFHCTHILLVIMLDGLEINMKHKML